MCGPTMTQDTNEAAWRRVVNARLDSVEIKLTGSVQTKPTNANLVRRVRKAVRAEAGFGMLTVRLEELARYLARLAPREHEESELPTHFTNQSSERCMITEIKDDYLLNKINYMSRNQNKIYPSSLFTALKIERSIRWAGR